MNSAQQPAHMSHEQDETDRDWMYLYQGQMLYEGKTPWEAFIRPFEAQALSCGWDTSEKLFRLTNSLGGDAAEFVFCQLTADVVDNYQKLIQALEARFKERRAVTSYLAQLEGRKQQTKETLSEFIADIRRLVVNRYPTADEETRETIALCHFLKGLSDQQAAIHVGMTSPKTGGWKNCSGYLHQPA